MKIAVLFFLIMLIASACTFSQGFLHVDDKSIVDGNGQNVLLRGMGLGGWMLQEGYMMKTSSFANAQYQIKDKIKALVGADRCNEFYAAWLDNYIRQVDVDSLKAWGFNSIRLPMHYNLYTLPIEEEPVAGQNTWLEKGFSLTDQLLQWCAANEMYLILDLHATPGGQGKESGISDYNPGKPSLWESAVNRSKTVALWKKLAERYVNEPWMGGYDLINETNWSMTNNKPLKDLYVEITRAIREVDKNHIVFIEGNWFANDFTGLTPPWDDNMVYSFHKYWSYNDQASIQWMLDIRSRHNIPIWCGEAGENSNVWFTDAIKLLEKHNIGWAWWPYKKIQDISGPLSIPKSSGYDRLLDYWSGTAVKPSADFAYDALMALAVNLKLENCIFQRDVIDAMFRQVQEVATKAFMRHDLPGLVFAVDYDLGSNGYAYADNQYADYHVSTDVYTSWNDGWIFRNDGVDIEACSDNTATKGYDVGWIANDEWLAFTVNVDETAAYDFSFRIASATTAGRL
ncbi:MAG: carbohydrate-binding protein, partial [Calditrichaeota bacterium]